MVGNLRNAEVRVVGHNHAVVCSRIKVYGIHTDTVANDGLELRVLLKDLSRIRFAPAQANLGTL